MAESRVGWRSAIASSEIAGRSLRTISGLSAWCSTCSRIFSTYALHIPAHRKHPFWPNVNTFADFSGSVFNTLRLFERRSMGHPLAQSRVNWKISRNRKKPEGQLGIRRNAIADRNEISLVGQRDYSRRPAAVRSPTRRGSQDRWPVGAARARQPAHWDLP